MDNPTLWESLLTGPILGLYLWTWLMFGSLIVLAAGLYITRDWVDPTEDSSIPSNRFTDSRREA